MFTLQQIKLFFSHIDALTSWAKDIINDIEIGDVGVFGGNAMSSQRLEIQTLYGGLNGGEEAGLVLESEGVNVRNWR